MANELTKSAKKSLATLYREYCQRLNAGEKKAQATSFQSYSEFVMDNRKELKDAGFIRVDLLGNIYLTDKTIIYMENKTADAIKEWLSFGTQFIP